MKPPISFKHVVFGTVIAAFLCAAVNNIWLAVFNATTTNAVSHIIHVGSVTTVSIMPLVVAGLFFYVVQKFSAKGTIIYCTIAIILGLLSCYSSFMRVLPDGTTAPNNFVYLSLPMHVVSIVFAALIPRFSARFSA